MPRLIVKLDIGFPGATHEDFIDIDDDEWADCQTDKQREDLIDSYAMDWANNYIEVSAEIVEPDHEHRD